MKLKEIIRKRTVVRHNSSYSSGDVQTREASVKGAVDCEDDDMMIRVGLRPPHIIPVKKGKLSDMDRQELKHHKKISNDISRVYFKDESKFMRVPKVLTVCVRNSKKEKDFKTTYTSMCYSDEIIDNVSKIGGTPVKICFDHEPLEFKIVDNQLILL